MPIIYDKLFEVLKERGLTTSYWMQKNDIHPSTTSKLRRNKTVTTETIAVLCELLGVQPGEIMEYRKDDAMPRYVILIGNDVSYTRHRDAATLMGAKQIKTREEKNGYQTKILDTSITATDESGQLNYAEIDRDGNQTGWRLASVLDNV